MGGQSTLSDKKDVDKMRLVWALNVLGIAKGTVVRSSTELEKIRLRTKELYKRFKADGKDREASKVPQAFEFLKARFDNERESRHKTPQIRKVGSGNGGAGHDTKGAKDGERQGASGTTQDVKTSTSDVSENPLVGSKTDPRDGTVCEIPRKALHDSSHPQTCGNKRARLSELPVESPSITSLDGANPPQCSVSGTVNPLQRSTSGTLHPAQRTKSGTLHLPQRSTSGTLHPPQRTTSGTLHTPQRSTSGNLHLPQRSVSGVTLVCPCGETCYLKQPPTSFKSGAFSCPSCRFRGMDPFNPVVEGNHGMLKLMHLQPLVPPDATEAIVQFDLELPDLQKWRKAGDDIEARMCCVDQCDIHQKWPETLCCSVNDKELFQISPPQKGHKRRDAPKKISVQLRSGTNSFDVKVTDPCLKRFVLAIVRTTPQKVRQVCTTVPVASQEVCRQRLGQLMFSSMLESTGDEVHAAGSDRCRLTCPITMARMVTPVRGLKCMHLQCFDLVGYLVSNLRMGAFNRRWICPVCDLVLRPRDLFVDAHVLRVLDETEDDDAEVAFESSGTWTVTAKANVATSSESEGGGGFNESEDDEICCIVSETVPGESLDTATDKTQQCDSRVEDEERHEVERAKDDEVTGFASSSEGSASPYAAVEDDGYGLQRPDDDADAPMADEDLRPLSDSGASETHSEDDLDLMDMLKTFQRDVAQTC